MVARIAATFFNMAANDISVSNISSNLQRRVTIFISNSSFQGQDV